ncbi:hypothetical protein PLANPX_4156 [Lacipirellula parvula]|uniref:Uncharacterized protein n=1 Tax=Lacipirellula parvula TaxID=2650471 RepID=A0A5K7XCM6_9BACT|nr:hypothetical protein PLANPX_4156 [Lacipirellula parvula]
MCEPQRDERDVRLYGYFRRDILSQHASRLERFAAKGMLLSAKTSLYDNASP